MSLLELELYISVALSLHVYIICSQTRPLIQPKVVDLFLIISDRKLKIKCKKNDFFCLLLTTSAISASRFIEQQREYKSNV